MLLRVVAVALVIMACASEASGATLNCTAVEEKISSCFRELEQNKSSARFKNRLAVFNIRGVTALLKKQKNNGCIKASEWPDVQAWIKAMTPPKSYIAIHENLTKTQKATLGQAANSMDNEQLQEKAKEVYLFINDELNILSEADRKKYFEWTVKYYETCRAP